jgi:PAS domain S-box-containing protein
MHRRAATTWRRSHITPLGIGALLVCLGSFAGSTAVGTLRFGGDGPAILFPPYAVLAAPLIVTPPRTWWLFLLAASLGSLGPHRAISPTPHVLIAELANYTKALVTAFGVRWAVAPAERDLGSMRAMGWFLLFAAGIGPVVAGLIGAASAVAFAGATHYWIVWRGWALSNALTGLTLLPVLLVGLTYVARRRGEDDRPPRPDPRRVLEAAALGAGLLAVSAYVFWVRPAVSLPSRLGWPLPFLLWAAVRFGPGGTSLSLLTITVLAIAGAVSGRGPFSGAPPAEQLLELQFFLLALALPLLLLSALARQQGQTQVELGTREREARRQLALLDAIYRTVPTGLAYIDTDMRYVRINDYLAGLHGVPAEAHVGRTLRELMSPELVGDVEARFREVIRTGTPMTHVELHDPRDGRSWLANYYPVRDERGVVIGVNASVQEVTALRQGEAKLRESEMRFRSVADSVPAFLYLLDEHGRPQFLNKALLDYHGLSEAEFMRMDEYEPIHPDDRPATSAGFGAAFRARQPFSCEYRMRRYDGVYRWFANTALPRFDPAGTFLGYAGSCLDVTDRVRAESARRESEGALRGTLARAQDLAGRLIASQENERSRIARELHDDVNQQLAALCIALSGLRRRVPAGSDIEHDLAELQERAVQLSDDIRDLSHEFHPGVLRHAGLVAALQSHCGEFRARHHIPVVFRADDGLGSVAPDVALCLYRVTQEALVNVARHARAQQVRVDLGRQPAGGNGHGGTLELVISDDGCGFDAVHAREAGGLGLTSLDERVRLAGGTLDILTERDRGTIVRARIPLKGHDDEARARAACG